MARQLLTRFSVRDAFAWLTVPDLKEYVDLLPAKPMARKEELVEQLTSVTTNPTRVRALYGEMDALEQSAIQEATHDPDGRLHEMRFAAKYGAYPAFHTGEHWSYNRKPSRLRLFFPQGSALPSDLQAILQTFVPQPPPLVVRTVTNLPSVLTVQWTRTDKKDVPIRVRETGRPAQLDVKAVLRLIENGDLKVGEKTGRPSAATVKTVAAVLADGDFFPAEDASDQSHDPASDLTIKPYAWPLLFQAAGLATPSGSKLQLTPAGVKASAKSAHQILRQLWDKWVKTNSFDEYSRIDLIKGQQSKNAMSAVAPRREVVVQTLATLPLSQWIPIDEFFRQLKVNAQPFSVARDPSKLYLRDRSYNMSGGAWTILEGRYAMVLLFEYAATLGLLDVAYVPPMQVRQDSTRDWDDFTCLSRYDGLLYFRINSLGAWCLKRSETYEPPVFEVKKVFRVLPNLDVVANEKAPGPADVLLLERLAERQSESVWRLSREKALTAIEQGQTIREFREFLKAKSGDLPQTVTTLLNDLEVKSEQLEDLGTMRAIGCKDSIQAKTLACDRRLRGVCLLANERFLVFRVADEATVRRTLKELGYVLPPPR